MKISIWHQWASNHSSDFVVVGEFATAEAASAAAEKLHEILTAIAEFKAYNYIDPAKYDELTEPEIKLAEEYHLQWEKSLDWLTLENDLRINAVDGYLSAHRNRVFVTCGPFQTHLGATPFDQLMTRFSDQVLVGEENRVEDIHINLTCFAPDEDTAKTLYEQAHVYLVAARNEKEHETPIPWIAYATGTRHMLAEQIIAAQDIYLREGYSVSAAKQLPGFREMFEAHLNTWLGRGRVERDGTELRFRNLWMSNHIGIGLRALTAWLSEHGCRDIEIELFMRNIMLEDD